MAQSRRRDEPHRIMLDGVEMLVGGSTGLDPDGNRSDLIDMAQERHLLFHDASGEEFRDDIKEALRVIGALASGDGLPASEAGDLQLAASPAPMIAGSHLQAMKEIASISDDGRRMASDMLRAESFFSMAQVAADLAGIRSSARNGGHAAGIGSRSRDESGWIRMTNEGVRAAIRTQEARRLIMARLSDVMDAGAGQMARQILRNRDEARDEGGESIRPGEYSGMARRLSVAAIDEELRDADGERQARLLAYRKHLAGDAVADEDMLRRRRKQLLDEKLLRSAKMRDGITLLDALGGMARTQEAARVAEKRDRILRIAREEDGSLDRPKLKRNLDLFMGQVARSATPGNGVLAASGPPPGLMPVEMRARPDRDRVLLLAVERIRAEEMRRQIRIDEPQL